MTAIYFNYWEHSKHDERFSIAAMLLTDIMEATWHFGSMIALFFLVYSLYKSFVLTTGAIIEELSGCVKKRFQYVSLRFLSKRQDETEVSVWSEVENHLTERRGRPTAKQKVWPERVQDQSDVLSL